MSRTSNLHYTEMESPFGPLVIAQTKKGICWLSFQNSTQDLTPLVRWSRKHFLTDQMKRDDEGLKYIIDQLNEYFLGNRKQFNVELDLIGTPFQKLVWKALLNIQYGEVKTYKDIAKAIGAPKSVRAVGGANNKNPVSIIVPCHRVIGTNGALVGYGSGLHIKQKLLDLECGKLELFGHSGKEA